MYNFNKPIVHWVQMNKANRLTQSMCFISYCSVLDWCNEMCHQTAQNERERHTAPFLSSRAKPSRCIKGFPQDQAGLVSFFKDS